MSKQTSSEVVPAQLQVNGAGAWKTVVNFDADNEQELDAVEKAAVMLFEVSPTSAFRIATRGRHPVVLAHMGGNTYGLWISKKFLGGVQS